MNKISLLFLIIIVSPNLFFSQEKFKTPPGTIYLKENLFIDKAPITNTMFLEYMTAKEFLRKNGFQSFKEYQQSNNETIEKLTYLYPSYLQNLNVEGSFLSRKNYFKDYDFRYSPVLNITKEQAEDYCKWRTEMVRYYMKREGITNPKNVTYRLPEYDELDLAKEHFSEASRYKFYAGKNPTKFKTTKEVDNFIIYKISEFTASNKLFGTNWKSEIPTIFPNDVTGFRCICEI